MDKTFASLGIPVSISSDNGPPFNSQDFSDFSNCYLGFCHERKTPLNPQANAEAEQFIRVLKKLYQISKLTGLNFKQEVYRFLRAYRATPHCTTKIAPADLMNPGRKFRTRLPIRVIPRERNFEELFQRDLEKKMQMKGYADNKRYVKPTDIQVGDSFLVRQETRNKVTPAYETEPLQAQYRKGTKVVAKRPDGSSITRTTAYFKNVPTSNLVQIAQQSLSVSHHQALEKMGPLDWSRRMEAWLGRAPMSPSLPMLPYRSG